MSKYRVLIQGLTGNKDLKGLVLSGALGPATFVRMKEIELASAEVMKSI